MANGPAVFQAYYDEPYNVIVQPNRFLYYFRLRWMRELGPVGTSIVIYLRGLCYYNPDKGEKRDVCEAKYEDIGDAIGVSRLTIVREMGPHAKDGLAKGIKKGDLVNPALQKFVAKQAQFNLTDKGVRLAANVYRVRMDDPIHSNDQAHYELLCSQYMARQNQPETTPKPVYKDTRTGTGMAQSVGKKPEAQVDSLANSLTDSSPPEARFDSQASEADTAPANQNDTANSLNVLFTNVETFNVREEDKNIKHREESPQNPDVIASMIDAKVSVIVSTLQDGKSEKRYWQLAGICEKHNVLPVLDEALQVTATKMKAVSVVKPGAYFQSIVLKHLENRGIHVPPAADVAHASKAVALAVRESLGGTGDALSQAAVSNPAMQPTRTLPSHGTQGNELSEIAALERAGGPECDSWAAFVREKRNAYVEATKEMTPGLRERSLSPFDSPERRRSLWRQFSKERDRI